MRAYIRKCLNFFVYFKTKLFHPSVKLGSNCAINASVYFCGTNSIIIGNDTDIRHYAILSPGHGFISVGNNSSIGAFNYIDGNGGVEIGNNVRIAPHCSIYSANHVFSRPDCTISSQGLMYGKVTIGDDVWIGANTTILAGVKIGMGSVIAAGAVVNRDVEPYSVIAGVPGKMVKKRE